MLQPKSDAQIAEMTKLFAKAAFPDGSLAIDLRDQLGPISEDTDFATLCPELGQPSLSPARLALITVLQFADDLPDRQAAITVRSHID